MGTTLQMESYEHFAIDIETTDADPTEAERWARLHWKPDSRWKPETIGARYIEAVEKKKEKLALIDASPVIAIAIRTERDYRCLHCMRIEEPRMIQGGLVEGFGSERDMLLAFRNLTDRMTDPETLLVGHNIKRFDLPKLRHRMIRNGLRLPAVLAADQPMFDSMVQYCRFTLQQDPFVAIGDLLEIFGLPSHKGLVDGGQVPELYRAGKVDELIAYAMTDVCAEYGLFLRMVGLASDEEPGGSPTTPSIEVDDPAMDDDEIVDLHPAAAANPTVGADGRMF